MEPNFKGATFIPAGTAPPAAQPVSTGPAPALTRADMLQIAQEEGTDPALVLAHWEQESGSGTNPAANTPQAHGGAVGGMQMTPATFKAFMPNGDINNPRDNARAGAKYLKHLQDKFPDNQPAQSAAYFTGEGAVAGVNGDVSKLAHRNDGTTSVPDYASGVSKHYQRIQGELANGPADAQAPAVASAPSDGQSHAQTLPRGDERWQGSTFYPKEEPAPPAAEPADKPGVVSDFGNLLGWGSGQFAQGASHFANWLSKGGTDELSEKLIGAKLTTIADDVTNTYFSQMSPEMKAAANKEWISETPGPAGSGEMDKLGIGDAWKDPRAWESIIVSSVPSTIMSVLPAATGARFAAKIAFNTSITKSLAKGVAPAAARVIAEKAAERAASFAGAAGGGAAEGAIAGGQQAQQVEQYIDKLPDDVLAQHPEYQKSYWEAVDGGKPDGEARYIAKEKVKGDASAQATWQVATATALLGGVFDGWLGKKLAQRMTPEGMATLGSRKAEALHGALIEGGTELTQGAAEQVLSNKAQAEHANVNQDLMEGVPNNAVASAVAGTVSGGAMGAAVGGGHAAAAPGNVNNLPRADQPIPTPGVPAETTPVPPAPPAPGTPGGAPTPADVQKARDETDTSPTEAQKKNGKYDKGVIDMQGILVHLENPKGSERSGVDENGKPWTSKMVHDYGEAQAAIGMDGDWVDIFLGKHLDSPRAFVVNQVHPETGVPDEHKVMLGFDSKYAAKKGYLVHYPDGWKGLGSITELSISELKAQMAKGAFTKPVTPESISEVDTNAIDTGNEQPSGEPEHQGDGGQLEGEGQPGNEPSAEQAASGETGSGDSTEQQAQEPAATPNPRTDQLERIAQIYESMGDKERADEIRSRANEAPHGMENLDALEKMAQKTRELWNIGNGREKDAPVETPQEEPVAQEPVTQEAAVEMPPPEAPAEQPQAEPAVADEGTPAEVQTPEAPKEEPKERLTDVGKKMEGKRADEVAKDIHDAATGNAKKDLQKILDRASKSALWPIELAEAATPGTTVYLTRVRDSLQTFLEYAGKKAGGGRGKWEKSFRETLETALLDGDYTVMEELEKLAGEYISTIEALRAVTKHAMSIDLARIDLGQLLVNDFSNTKPSNYVDNLSDTGRLVAKIAGKGGISWFARPDYGLASSINDSDSLKTTKPMVRPELTDITRDGMPDYRNGKDVTGQDFIDTFGFRGVEFGNWVNAIERQTNVNLAFDSLHDLAATLGIPVKGISLGGKLGLAFGSRGRGKAAAHYESGNVVINLTKTKGDGTVAHEWGHAFDYALRSSSLKAVNDLKTSLSKVYDLERMKSTLDSILKGHTKQQGAARKPILELARSYIRGLWRQQNWGGIKWTAYQTQANIIGKQYWGSPDEMWARAFEAMVYDTMPGSSPYLVTSWVADGTVTQEAGYKGRAYAAGEERAQFNAFFQHLLTGIEWTDEGPKIKAGYVSIESARLEYIQAELDKIGETLEERLKQLEDGVAAKDGLWWYRFGEGKKRGAGLQPKGHFALDDSQNAVAYPAPLDASDKVEFGLTKMEGFEPGAQTIYLNKDDDNGTRDRTRDNPSDEVRDDGEEALGEIPPKDGATPEGSGDVPDGAAERAGDGEGSDRATGEQTGERSGERAGDGTEQVHTPAERGTGTDTKSGQDAVQPTGTNYRITDQDHVGEGSIEQKFADNIAAITTLKAIESANRLATPAEQKILVKYVGWGGMPQAFGYHRQSGWEFRKKQLTDLLTPEEYEAARASTTNAHFTSPKIITAIWNAVARLGFKGGRVLEPAVGAGHFFGLMPKDMVDASKLVGIELDNLTARIAKQLYQRASITQKGFETVKFPERFFDLSISNVPFSDADRPVDKKYNQERMNLHDYFFRKAIELTRPGGVIAFITSKGTLDKQSQAVRKILNEKAEMIGAIRLPEDAFSENANTTVTTDIIFLRRRVEGAALEAKPWIDTAPIKVTGQYSQVMDYHLNEYYAARPEMMLGELYMRDNRYGSGYEVGLRGDKTSDLGAQLDGAVKTLQENVVVTPDRVQDLERAATAIPLEGDVKDGGFTVKEGKLYKREGDLMEPIAEVTPSEKNRGRIIRDSLKVRDTIRTMLRDRMNDASEEQIKTDKNAIEKEYKAFVKKNGYLNDAENVRAFAEDPDAALLLAVEKWDADTEKAERIDIDFKKLKPIDHADNVNDGLIATLAEHGRVDWQHIARLTGMPIDEAQTQLAGMVFDDPSSGWVTAEQYLSGNVREKLQIAKSAAAADQAFAPNVKALEAAQPVDLPPSKITVRPGAPWVPGSDVATFMSELMNVRADRFDVNFVPTIGKWVIGGAGKNESQQKGSVQSIRRTTEATVTWGTRSVGFLDLMDYAMNGGFPVVYLPPDENGKRAVNRKATEEAGAKLELIKDRFSAWVWEDAERAVRLGRKYNDEMNNIRLATYKYPASAQQINEKGDIRLPGMAVGMWLRPHQADAVWRIIQSGNTYLAHEVGTGKTFTMVAAIMEMKRLGIAKKPMLSVLNSTIGQFKAEFLRLYPGANILSMNFSEGKNERKRQLARIALNDWDAVIITHDNAATIPMSEAAITANFMKEIGNLSDAILASKADQMNAKVVKELEKSKKSLENKMKLELGKRKKDDLLSFEELGVDHIFVDEAQEFKNLMFTTRMGRQMRGLNPAGSGRAFDLYMKANWLNDTFGRGVVFASGTPLSNSVGELYSISRYLQPSELEKRSIQMFDPWANTFGKVERVGEYLPEGGGYQMVTKFRKFVNIPELMQMVYSVMDSVSADKAGVKRPAIKGGKQQATLVPQNEGVAAYMEALQERAENIRKNPRAALPDNMLVVVSDGRKAAMDMRLVDPAAPDYEQTKTNVAVQNIFAIYKAEMDKKGTQLVFSDIGVPGEDKFSVYDDLKKKLVAKGIPAEEIAFIHDAKNDRERRTLFSKVNSGKIRVFVGSTKKAGTGVNVQERVAAIHNLDTHWNLANLLQRLGRGQRQGNIYDEIAVNNYTTEASVDAFMWDKVQQKGRFVDQVMSGDVTLREAEDISQETMSAAEMVAITSGDPMIAEKVELESVVQRLSLQASAFDDTLASVRKELVRLPQRIAAIKEEAVTHEKEAKRIRELTSVKIGREEFTLGDEKTSEALNTLIHDLALANTTRFDALETAVGKNKVNLDDKRATIIGSVSGDGYSFPLRANRAHFGTYIELLTDAGAVRWDDDKTIEKGLTKSATDYEKAAEVGRGEIETMQAELPKLKAEAGKKFEKAGELDKKRARLTEIDRILTNRDAREAIVPDSDDASALYRFTFNKDGASLVTTFKDVKLNGLDDIDFFTHPQGVGWVLTERRTGLQMTTDATEEGVVSKAQQILDAKGEDKVRAAIDAKPSITSEDKDAAMAEASDSDTALSRGAIGLGSISFADLQDAVSKLSNELGLETGLVIAAPSIEALPQAVQDKIESEGASDVDGVYHNGRVYLVQEGIADARAARRVMVHELTHLGLRKAFGRALDSILNQIGIARRAQVDALLKTQGLQDTPANRAAMAEEVLAIMAQSEPHLGFVRRAIAAIKSFLREHGILSREGITDDEIIREYILPARKAAQSATIVTQAPEDATLFSRSPTYEAAINLVKAITKTDSQVSFWSRTVGTMSHMAQTSAPFRRVFDAGQDFLRGIWQYSTAAQKLAPSWFKTGFGIDRKNANVVADWLLHGTLLDRLFSEQTMRTGTSFDVGEGTVELKPLNDKQITMYKEAHAAIRQVLEDQGKVHIARIVQSMNIPLNKELNLTDYTESVKQHIDVRIAEAKGNIKIYTDAKTDGWEATVASLEQGIKNDEATKKMAQGVLDHVDHLSATGYFPMSRFGSHYSVMYKSRADYNAGNASHFSLHESQTAANLNDARLKKANPTAYFPADSTGIVSKDGFRLYDGLNLDALELFAKKMGFEQNEMFQDAYKELFNSRSLMKRLIKRKGTAGYSTDVYRVLADFLVSTARSTSAMENFPRMMAGANDIQAGDVKDHAIALYNYLKDPISEAHKLRGYLFFHFLGGSLASALTNLTQTPLVTLPYLTRWSDPATVTAYMLAAGKEAVKDPFSKNKAGEFVHKGKLWDGMRLAEQDGTTASQETFQMMGVASGSKLAGNKYSEGFLKAWGAMFSYAETFNRRVAYVAAFNLATSKGMQDAHTFAEAAVNDTQFIYNKGNRPVWGRGPLGSTLMTFKQFNINVLELLARMPVQQKIYMLVLLVMAAGIEGLPFAEDLEDLIDTVGQRFPELGVTTNSKKWLDKHTRRIFGQFMGNALMQGVPSSVLPWDVSQRMSMGNLLPATAIGKISETDKFRDVRDAMGPIASLIYGAASGAENILKGNFVDAAKLALPVAAQNAIKGGQMLATGKALDAKGQLIGPITKTEAAGKAVGLNPNVVASDTRVKASIANDENTVAQLKADIYQRYINGLVQQNPKDIQEAFRAVTAWNKANPTLPIILNPREINQKVSAAYMDLQQRTIKQAPKALRAEVYDQLKNR